jgi:N-acetyl sugar amidotransferase
VDTRPDGGPFEDGICQACRFTEARESEIIDWQARRKELDEIIKWGKEHTRTKYDCIVTVSGGKDSTRQAFYARDELKLRPLLVSYLYPPEQLHERGAHNLSNLISHGFDAITVGLNPQVEKEMMRQGFYRFGNQAKSTELALYAAPLHVAIAYKIPLIFLGENPLYTLGQQEGKSVGGDAHGMQYSRTLGGGSPDNLMTDDMTLRDTCFYRYPSEDEINYLQLRIVYLGYYIEDWSDFENAMFAIDRGLMVRTDSPEKTGDLFGFVSLDEEFKIVNQLIKYIKFGYGNVTDHLITLINLGVMERDEAFELLHKYDGKCDDHYIRLFCKYLNIPEEEFWRVVESYRGQHIWKKDENGQWKLRVDED